MPKMLATRVCSFFFLFFFWVLINWKNEIHVFLASPIVKLNPMKRSASDICLLCLTNPSTKTNSHILPKFLSKELFGPKQQKKGFQVSSSNPINHPKHTIQDSPKENYILCPECEDYFSLLETICSDVFNTWKQKSNNGEYTLTSYKKLFSIVFFKTMNSKVFRLMIYSIFWRSSVTNHAVFNRFQIIPEIEEKIRESLVLHKSVNKSELQKVFLSMNKIPLYPISIITSETFKDQTSNLIFASPRRDVYLIIMDQFSLMMFENDSKVTEELFRLSSNMEVEDCKMLVFKEETWMMNIVQPILDLIAKSIVENS
ncbi:hypothetical protein [Fluviicola taffensis]|uniref:Uncharacterized protein n=1 Tax=Fluviicola taffensis (strain DSM 16823 / NCIMB 13979 / RW262) TaxID=755732 RepID=F2IJA3_FLUTR|nr:hypothetical protein [Fluviicola taffensis]AEA44973.1 hypothetical protein Fluta_2994 [Fluviicola taffensis DSM 16823]